MNTLRGTLSRFGWTNDARPSRGPAEFGGSDDKYASGIGPSGPTPTMGNGSSSSHDRDARLAKITFWLRISSLVLCFCSLICAIVAATFQKKWIGGPSGLTGFLLFVNVAFLLISGVFTIMPWLVERETGGKKVVSRRGYETTCAPPACIYSPLLPTLSLRPNSNAPSARTASAS